MKASWRRQEAFCFLGPMRTSFIAALVTLILGVLLAGLYWSGLHGPFFFDDQPNILKVESVRLDTLSWQALRDVWTSGGSGPFGRPVAQLSFSLNYYFSGLDPFVFKLTNLAIHFGAGALVFALALRLFASVPDEQSLSYRFVASALLAALWLVHPIQLLPVLHVVQRMTSLSAFFLLAALLCHLRGRERNDIVGLGWIVVSWGVFWPFSVLSKETGLLFPIFVLAWELIVRRAMASGLDRFARVFALLAGIGLTIVVAYMLLPSGQWLWAGYGMRSFSLVERMLTEGRVLWFYLSLILFPRLEAFGLFHDDFAISSGIFDPLTTLPALAGLAGLVWLAWWGRVRSPLLSFGLGWFLIGHVMESTVMPLEIAHEHRNYLPLFGILLAAIALLIQGIRATGARKTMSVALVAVMLAYFSFLTALRAHEFGDELRRTQIEAQHHRGSARAQHEAGRTLAGFVDPNSSSSPAYSLAKVHYELAGQLDPDFKMNWLGLIHLNCLAGVPLERSWINELERRLRNNAFAPGDRTVLYSLKEMSIAHSICLERRDVDTLFAATIANQRVSPSVRAMLHSWHADYLWLQAADLPAARAALDQSLAVVPTNASNRLKWAQLQYLSGEYEQAKKLLLVLRDDRLSLGERKTLDELLSEIDMRESQTPPSQVEQ